jgi:hypothetical protein
MFTRSIILQYSFLFGPFLVVDNGTHIDDRKRDTCTSKKKKKQQLNNNNQVKADGAVIPVGLLKLSLCVTCVNIGAIAAAGRILFASVFIDTCCC